MGSAISVSCWRSCKKRQRLCVMKVKLQNLKQIAHQQVHGDEELEWMEGGVERARKRTNNFPAFISEMNSDGKVTWGGFQFKVCCAHCVYNLLVESIAEGFPIRQIVCCGVGQDYHYMRNGDDIRRHGRKCLNSIFPT
mmetsp:Transcript_12454/g.22629  ORF Transcript_12454/g.22629 Transcript_12454/m.22629 type:complete len:138 (-) Transcript_12454:281-694(-)